LIHKSQLWLNDSFDLFQVKVERTIQQL
jgi:hypothetical protein